MDGSVEVLSDAQPFVGLADVQLSPDGKCAAYLPNGAELLRFVDVERNRSFDFVPIDPPFNGDPSLTLTASAWQRRKCMNRFRCA